jgi:hypothetical protein
MPPSLLEWLPEEHLVWTWWGRSIRWTLIVSTRRIGLVERVVLRMTRRCWPELNRSSQRGVPVTLKAGSDDLGRLGDAAVVAEARAERVPERR